MKTVVAMRNHGQYMVAPQAHLPQQSVMPWIVEECKSAEKRIVIFMPGYAISYWYVLCEQYQLIPKHRITFVTYEMLAAGALYQTSDNTLNPDICIIDQYHHVVRSRAKATRKTFAIAATAKKVIALDPVLPANAWELWPLLNLFGRTMLPQSRFASHYCNVRRNAAGNLSATGWRKSSKAELLKLLDPHITCTPSLRGTGVIPYAFRYTSQLSIELLAKYRGLKRLPTDTADTSEYVGILSHFSRERAGQMIAWVRDFLAAPNEKLIIFTAGLTVTQLLYAALSVYVPVVFRDDRSVRAFTRRQSSRVLICLIDYTHKLPAIELRPEESLSIFFAEPDVIAEANHAARSAVSCHDPLTFVATSRVH